MNVPTPLLAAGLFVITFAGNIALLVTGEAVPDALWGMTTLFAGAAVGGAMPTTITARRR